ncbi:MAG: site-specific integrase, partial [Thermoanaerobaculia bacterium]
MTPLRQSMIEKLELRNYSQKTVTAYVTAVAHSAKHFGRSPDQLTGEEIHQWQIHLRDVRKVSWSAFNVAMSALRFFYR